MHSYILQIYLSTRKNTNFRFNNVNHNLFKFSLAPLFSLLYTRTLDVHNVEHPITRKIRNHLIVLLLVKYVGTSLSDIKF